MLLRYLFDVPAIFLIAKGMDLLLSKNDKNKIYQTSSFNKVQLNPQNKKGRAIEQ
jgi:hypothetical protein